MTWSDGIGNWLFGNLIKRRVQEAIPDADEKLWRNLRRRRLTRRTIRRALGEPARLGVGLPDEPAGVPADRDHGELRPWAAECCSKRKTGR